MHLSQVLGKGHPGSTVSTGPGVHQEGPQARGQPPAEASLGTLPTGHGELKLETDEWEAADTAILCALHPLRFHSPAPLT